MASTTAQKQPKAVIHPWVDALAIGGISIGFISYLLVVQPEWNGPQIGERFVVLAALLNWPHFMATYRLLYGSSESVKRYPWSSIWMPLLLGVYCLMAAISVPWTRVPLDIATFVAGGYLAWHYTGQTWGMMATFSFLGGAPFEDVEKKLIRFSLRCLLTWHVVWFLYFTKLFHSGRWLHANASWAYTGASILLVGTALATGLTGLIKYARRIERIPPVRVLIPWTSIWIWYALLAVWPFALFWVQLSHSLQYLIFPARVEANRAAEQGGTIPWRRWAMWGVIVLGSGVAVFKGLPVIIEWSVPVLGKTNQADVELAVGAFINIHHYFADGVIWKLSNPYVRKELFSHLRR